MISVLVSETMIEIGRRVGENGRHRLRLHERIDSENGQTNGEEKHVETRGPLAKSLGCVAIDATVKVSRREDIQIGQTHVHNIEQMSNSGDQSIVACLTH